MFLHNDYVIFTLRASWIGWSLSITSFQGTPVNLPELARYRPGTANIGPFPTRFGPIMARLLGCNHAVVQNASWKSESTIKSLIKDAPLLTIKLLITQM